MYGVQRRALDAGVAASIVAIPTLAFRDSLWWIVGSNATTSGPAQFAALHGSTTLLAPVLVFTVQTLRAAQLTDNLGAASVKLTTDEPKRLHARRLVESRLDARDLLAVALQEIPGNHDGVHEGVQRDGLPGERGRAAHNRLDRKLFNRLDRLHEP